MTDTAFQVDAFQPQVFQVPGINAFQQDAFDDGAWQEYVNPGTIVERGRSQRSRLAFLAYSAPFGMSVARDRKL